MDEYLEDAQAYIEAIQIGFDTCDMSMIVRGSHTLKSNSQGFGLIVLAKTARSINDAADSQDIHALKALIPELHSAFLKGRQELKQALLAYS